MIFTDEGVRMFLSLVKEFIAMNDLTKLVGLMLVVSREFEKYGGGGRNAIKRWRKGCV